MYKKLDWSIILLLFNKRKAGNGRLGDIAKVFNKVLVFLLACALIYAGGGGDGFASAGYDG